MNPTNKLILIIILFETVCSFAQNENILIQGTSSPSEPSIMIDPLHPNVMVAGAILDDVYISTDSGYTWSKDRLSSSYGVWGDPVIAVDNKSNWYYFHLSNPRNGNWIDRIVCQKSTDGGENWNNGSYAGLNGAKAQDKQWVTVDRTDNTIYMTWTQFDDYGSSSASCKSSILFSKSTDLGESWTPAKRINEVDGNCIDEDNTTEGAVPALGPEKQLYVAWAGPEGLVFDRSLDGGTTWLDNDIKINDMPGGWDYEIPGLQRCNGLPVTQCDTSYSPYRGRIYVNWTDQRNGTDDTDVWLAMSDDGGNTWSDAIRVNNDDAGHQQFFTWMCVDQVTGYLHFVFYDRREHNNNSTDVYYALSTDGGQTFLNRKISESPFTPSSNTFFGDYTNIMAYDNIVRPIWARLSEGNMSVWTAIVRPDVILSMHENGEPIHLFELEQNYPNPSREFAYIAFKLRRNVSVTLSLKDIYGNTIATLIDEEFRHYGRHVIGIDLQKYGLSKGIYFYTLKAGNDLNTKKMLIEE